MLYAIFCYNQEDVTSAWAPEHEARVMGDLMAVQDRLSAAGKLGPVARLLPTTAATTLRKGDEPLVIDGPFAETKEQLLGFYVIDVADLDEALAVAKDLAKANPGLGSYEIRPLALFHPGGDVGSL
ncbi:MAG: hypothetical protein JWR84_4213 [Caulobacter sp.]|nr:hypothetical protein [Caulobacter sp.]